jgi:hypothetical protein
LQSRVECGGCRLAANFWQTGLHRPVQRG